MSTQATKSDVKKASTHKEHPDSKERKTTKTGSSKTGSSKTNSTKTQSVKTNPAIPASRKQPGRQSNKRNPVSVGQNAKTVGIKPATRLLLFTAKTVGKGLFGIIKLAARIPGLFVRSTKKISHGPSTR